MKIAIIYSSHTGNTECVASAIKEALKDQEVVYFGKIPKNLSDIHADLYFIGSWTDKGNSSSAHFVRARVFRSTTCSQSSP